MRILILLCSLPLKASGESGRKNWNRDHTIPTTPPDCTSALVWFGPFSHSLQPSSFLLWWYAPAHSETLLPCRLLVLTILSKHSTLESLIVMQAGVPLTEKERVDTIPVSHSCPNQSGSLWAEPSTGYKGGFCVVSGPLSILGPQVGGWWSSALRGDLTRRCSHLHKVGLILICHW